MKAFMKVAALVLVLLMLIPCLAACGGDGETTAADGGQGGGGGGTKPKPPTTITTPVVDMNRYKYKAYVRSNVSGPASNGSFYCEDFYVDPSTGGADSLSFAVIARNRMIEQTYNCSIIQQWSTLDNQYTELSTFFETDQKFELAIMVAPAAATAATSGLLSDLKADVNTKYMDLENPGFDQNCNDQMTLGENLYYCSGDMNISAMDNTVATIFNMDMFLENADGVIETLGADTLGVDYDPDNADQVLYDMVAAGTWTIDNMLKIADIVKVDVNTTDGVLDVSKGDTIGYFQYIASPIYYYYAAGFRITENEDGYPRFTITDDTARGAYEYIFNKLNTPRNPSIPVGASSARAQNFMNGSVLFADYILWDIRRVIYPSETDLYYGILPNPVMESGAEYHSLVYFQTSVHLWTIPYKRNSVEYSARMLEIMAAYSDMKDSTMDAYYIKTMYMNVARDDGSRASLDIIRDSLVYDIALLYSEENAGSLWGNFDNLLLAIPSGKNMEYDSYTSEARMTTAQQQLDDTITAFMEISENSRA